MLCFAVFCRWLLEVRRWRDGLQICLSVDRWGLSLRSLADFFREDSYILVACFYVATNCWKKNCFGKTNKRQVAFLGRNSGQKTRTTNHLRFSPEKRTCELMTQLPLTCRFFLQARNQPRLFDNIRPVRGLNSLVGWSWRYALKEHGLLPTQDVRRRQTMDLMDVLIYLHPHWAHRSLSCSKINSGYSLGCSLWSILLPWFAFANRKVRIGPKDLESLDLTCIASVMRFFVYFFLIKLSSPLKISRNRWCERGLLTRHEERALLSSVWLLTGLRLNQLDLPHCAGKQRNESGCCRPSFRYAKCDNNSWIESTEYLWPKNMIKYIHA